MLTWSDRYFERIMAPSFMRLCTNCKDEFCCEICKETDLKQFHNTVIHNRGNSKLRILCMSCKVPPCQASGCATCKSCRRPNCHDKTCKLLPTVMGGGGSRSPANAAEKATWHCEACKIQCTVCEQVLSKETMSDHDRINQSRKRDARGIWCIECGNPPCKVPNCKTCLICRDPSCKTKSCSSQKKRLHYQSIPTLERQAFWRCDGCNHCRKCGKAMEAYAIREVRKAQSVAPWFCRQCSRKK